MRSRSTRVRAYIGIASLGLTAALMQPAAAYASQVGHNPQAVPRGQGCSPFKKFLIAHKTFITLGDGNRSHGDAWAWALNRNAPLATLTVQIAAQSSVGQSITATASVDAGVIFAKVSASLAVGIEHSHSDTVTKGVQVSKIPKHQYGVAGTAFIYAKVTGTYETLQDGPGGKCVKKIVKNVIGKFPTNDPIGFETAISKAVPANPPWPVAPR
jgi:hypothetical protein